VGKQVSQPYPLQYCWQMQLLTRECQSSNQPDSHTQYAGAALQTQRAQLTVTSNVNTHSSNELHDIKLLGTLIGTLYMTLEKN
jgi:hypothetical protein